MPYNPISGQFEYGGETYDAPTVGVGMAMEGMGAVGADIPLAFRLMENMPGIAATAGFSARRFSNTMFEGGFLDVGSNASSRQVATARKFGSFVGDVAERPNARGFLFGGLRDANKLQDSTQFIKASRLNNFTLRPRIFNRFSSVSNLSGVTNAGFYTPFQGASFMSGMLERTKVRERLATRGLTADADRPLLTGGTLGRVSTMSKAYSMEQQQVRLLSKGTDRAIAKANKIGARLGGLDVNIGRLDSLVNPARTTLTPGVMYTIPPTTGYGSLASGYSFPATLQAQMPVQTRAQLASANRLRAISDTSGGIISRSITGYMGTMLDPTQFKGTRAYDALEQNIKRALYYSDDATTLAAKKASAAGAKATAAQFLSTGYADDIGKFGVKSLSSLSGRALAAGQSKVAMKLAGAAGARAVGLAIPGLNVIATASMVYDLTKMAATGIVSAGNFAKEAVKSMQGGLHKPAFGMGYKDNEVAATSRSRGVMAIQNSRLNARSMLGTEAAMMAAHYG